MSTSHEHETVYVRAKYDYTCEDMNTVINLREGELLRVVSKLESGWWDGLNSQGKRGWFPSNYCEPCETPREMLGSIMAKL
ncbi:hypothetical protein Vi05172_g4916 [Venturia inaequalis]|nr:hypothetical protein Vi05172_g4916 [Venturia inaequalis]